MTGNTFTLFDLVAASASVLERAEAAFQKEHDREQQDVAAAVAERSGLLDGYWKQAHVARLRYQSALALDEALAEIAADLHREGQSI